MGGTAPPPLLCRLTLVHQLRTTNPGNSPNRTPGTHKERRRVQFNVPFLLVFLRPAALRRMRQPRVVVLYLLLIKSFPGKTSLYFLVPSFLHR
ncbi:hypothetical protein GDO78_008018 [Eleutherodactylus coqui]|uniref:Uncharacterized protein n=1 Tax=Eleutherodactylus coqui TaxID=57060 RepID=A0A8J6FAR4_ELECQ|nr:hypothetical protein GDO78_008018 [Eleutherodactylus coqui]